MLRRGESHEERILKGSVRAFFPLILLVFFSSGCGVHRFFGSRLAETRETPQAESTSPQRRSTTAKTGLAPQAVSSRNVEDSGTKTPSQKKGSLTPDSSTRSSSREEVLKNHSDSERWSSERWRGGASPDSSGAGSPKQPSSNTLSATSSTLSSPALAEPSESVSNEDGERVSAGDQIAPPLKPIVSEVLLTAARVRSSSQVDSQVGVVDSERGEALPIFSFRAHQGAVNALVAAQDGAFSGGDDGSVNSLHLFKSKGGTAVRVEKILESTRPILALALSPDEKLLAVAQTGRVSIYDRKSKTVLYSLTRAKGRITTLAWDPRGELLAIGRADGDVVVWRISGGRFAGQNNIKALEVYRGANTPIVGIVFHPSARVFFAAEDDGGLSLWRLFRTAEEMGLRDTTAEVDLDREANDGRRFAQVQGRITDLWLSRDGAVIFLSAVAEDGGSDQGRVYSWRVRGLSPLGFFGASREEILSFTGFSGAFLKDYLGVNLLVATSRDQRLTFFCQRLSPPQQSIQPSPFHEILGRSGVFAQPASILRGRGELVWGTDRDGEFIIFRGSSVLSSPALSQKLRQCRN